MFIFFFSVQIRSSQKGWSEIEVKKPIGSGRQISIPPGGFNW